MTNNLYNDNKDIIHQNVCSIHIIFVILSLKGVTHMIYIIRLSTYIMIYMIYLIYWWYFMFFELFVSWFMWFVDGFLFLLSWFMSWFIWFNDVILCLLYLFIHDSCGSCDFFHTYHPKTCHSCIYYLYLSWSYLFVYFSIVLFVCYSCAASHYLANNNYLSDTLDSCIICFAFSPYLTWFTWFVLCDSFNASSKILILMRSMIVCVW